MVDYYFDTLTLKEVLRSPVVDSFKPVPMSLWGGRKFCFTGVDQVKHYNSIRELEAALPLKILNHVTQCGRLTKREIKKLEKLRDNFKKLDQDYTISIYKIGFLPWLLTHIRRLKNLVKDSRKNIDIMTEEALSQTYIIINGKTVTLGTEEKPFKVDSVKRALIGLQQAQLRFSELVIYGDNIEFHDQRLCDFPVKKITLHNITLSEVLENKLKEYWSIKQLLL